MALIVNGTTIPTNGDYVVVNNVKVSKVTCNGVVVWEKDTYAIGQSTSFEYISDNCQIFEVKVSGTYKLEVWGAQGSDNTQPASNEYNTALQSVGGKGGYSYGNVYLTAGTILYVCVGSRAGYNGGGSSYNNWANGGGATHIGTQNVLLQHYNGTSGLYIVAGGGGGGGWTEVDNGYGGATGNQTANQGGTGGGSSGGIGYGLGAGNGGTQSGGGQCYLYANDSRGSGSFGKGGDGIIYGADSEHDEIVQYCTGGGGGFYGGAAGFHRSEDDDSNNSGAGGGSGWVGGVSGGTSNGVRSGNGYAVITRVS